MKPEMVDATLEKRKHEEQEQTPDSTNNISDEDITDELDVKNVELNVSNTEEFAVPQLKQYRSVSNILSDVDEVEMEKPNTDCGSINHWENQSRNQVSVIKKTPYKSDRDEFPTPFMNNLGPFRKLEKVKVVQKIW